MLRFARHKVTADEAVDVSESNGVRALHLGSVTIQSAMRIKDPFALELTYTRAMMCFLLFGSKLQKILAIGLGGASLAKYVHAYCPDLHQTVIEINPKIIQIARSQFYLADNDARLEVIEGDGLRYLADNSAVADVLFIDAFDGNGIPPDFCSQDFFDACANSLNADGLMVINLWGSDKKFDVYLQRIEQSFAGKVLILPTGKPGNTAVFAFKREPADLRLASLRNHAKELERTHKIEFLQFVEKLAEHNPSSSNRLFMSNAAATS